MHELLSGGMIILVDGRGEAIAGDLRNGGWGAISEPTTEVTVNGVRKIEMNIMLIRRRLKTPEIWLERYIVGNVAKTNLNHADSF